MLYYTVTIHSKWNLNINIQYLQTGLYCPLAGQNVLDDNASLAPNWLVQATALRSKLNVPKDFKPWTSHSHFKGVGLSQTKRNLEMVDLGFIQACHSAKRSYSVAAAKREGLFDGLVVDVSQNPCRSPWTTQSGHAHTLTTSTLLYSYKMDRMLQPIEYLLLQGYQGTVNLEGLKADSIRKMAGEGVALPCLATILSCIHATKGFTNFGWLMNQFSTHSPLIAEAYWSLNCSSSISVVSSLYMT